MTTTATDHIELAKSFLGRTLNNTWTTAFFCGFASRGEKGWRRRRSCGHQACRCRDRRPSPVFDASRCPCVVLKTIGTACENALLPRSTYRQPGQLAVSAVRRPPNSQHRSFSRRCPFLLTVPGSALSA